MLKLMYIHGSFSSFSYLSEKVIALSKDFKVVGISYSMEDDFNSNIKKLKQFAIDEKVDFLVGTSLGGMYAAELSNILGIKSILINPSVYPRSTLHRLIGEHKNYATGNLETFKKESVESYPEKTHINFNNFVFIGLLDDIIDPFKTKEICQSNNARFYESKTADHRWFDFSYNSNIIDFVVKK